MEGKMKIFKISQALREEFESETWRKDWENLIVAIENGNLSPKDMIVLNLYFTFMGIDLSFGKYSLRI